MLTVPAPSKVYMPVVASFDDFFPSWVLTVPASHKLYPPDRRIQEKGQAFNFVVLWKGVK